MEIAEVQVNDSRSLDEILASISGDQGHSEIFEALKSVVTMPPGKPGAVAGARPPAPPAGDQFICPVCEKPVASNASTCPTCGALFEEGGAAEFECPVCRSTVAAEANRCPQCGVLFSEEVPAPPAVASPAAPVAAAPPAIGPPPPPPTPKLAVGLPERIAGILRSRKEAVIPPSSGDRKLMYRELPRYVNDVRGLLVSAKRMSLEIEREKKVINEAIVAGKQRDVERALRNIAEAKHALDIALTTSFAERINALLAQLQRATFSGDPAPLEAALREAIARLDSRNYDGALDEFDAATKAFQALARDYVTTTDSLGQDDRLVADLKALGVDVREVERIFRSAREAMEKRDQKGALRATQDGRDRLAKLLPDFVDKEMKTARNKLLDLKVRGGDLSKPVGILKAASVHAKKEDWGTAVRYLREFRKELEPL